MTGKTGGLGLEHTPSHHGLFAYGTEFVCVCREWDRSRERRRDYDRGRRERFSPSRHISPQHKRMRRDWWVSRPTSSCS